MKMKLMALLAASAMGLSACATPQMNSDTANIVGVAGGAAAGLAIAKELDTDKDGKLIGAMAGAAAGTLLAQNLATNQCAYARGDGTYYTAACR